MMGDTPAFHWQGQMTPGRMAVGSAMVGNPMAPQTQPTLGPQQFGGSHVWGPAPVTYGLPGLGATYQQRQPGQVRVNLGGGHNGYW